MKFNLDTGQFWTTLNDPAESVSRVTLRLSWCCAPLTAHDHILVSELSFRQVPFHPSDYLGQQSRVKFLRDKRTLWLPVADTCEQTAYAPIISAQGNEAIDCVAASQLRVSMTLISSVNVCSPPNINTWRIHSIPFTLFPGVTFRSVLVNWHLRYEGVVKGKSERVVQGEAGNCIMALDVGEKYRSQMRRPLERWDMAQSL